MLLLFAAFVRMGKPLWAVPGLFLTAIIAAGAVGWAVAATFAEPVNRALRRRFGVDDRNVEAAHSEADSS